jgi:putative peptidoglycan lipid II flippase
MATVLVKQNIKQASIFIAAFTVLSQALGLVRESLVANFLGTSAEYDVLLVALAVPAMVGTILMMALPSAGIPWLQTESDNSGKGFSILRSPFLRINAFISLILAIAIFMLLPFLAKLLATGLEQNQVSTVLKYGRIFCLLIPLRAFEAIFQCFLHVKYSFIFPSITVIAFNLVIIGLLIGLFPSMGAQAYVMAMVIGVFVEMVLVGLPAFLIYRGHLPAIGQAPFVAKAYVQYLGAIVLIEGIGLLTDPFDRYLGGIFLAPGFVSAAYYANITQQIPFRVFVMSLGTAIFPSLSELAAKKNLTDMASLYHRAIALCVIIMIPISVFAIFFQDEIIKILFERGRFDENSRAMTVSVFKYYLVGLIFPSLFFIQLRILYSFKRWKHLFWVRLSAFLAKCLIGLFFIKYNWALAIGGGTVFMFILSFILMEFHLVKKIGLNYSKFDFSLIGKAMLGAMIAVIITIIFSTAFGAISGISQIWFLVISAIGLFGSLIIIDAFFDISGIQLKKILSFNNYHFHGH